MAEFHSKSQFKGFPLVFLEGYQRQPAIGLKYSLTKTLNSKLLKIGKYFKEIETKSF